MTVWKPGMRCVFVGGAHHRSFGNYPVKGGVYTVRDARPCYFEGHMLIWLHELKNAHIEGTVGFNGKVFRGGEPGFGSHWFRPLSETRLDQFRIHLAPVDNRETV